MRAGLSLHLFGYSGRARQLYAEVLASQHPRSFADSLDLTLVMICMDQWAALGDADHDALLLKTLDAWDDALRDTELPQRAVPRLEKIRRQLRQGIADEEWALSSLNALAADANVLPRIRAESLLMAGFVHHDRHRPEQAQRDWRQAAAIMSGEPSSEDSHLQWMSTSFVAHVLARSWKAADSSAWLSAMLGKANSPSSGPGWIRAIMESLPGELLAESLNDLAAAERGLRFARDHTLRRRSARELMLEGTELFFATVFRCGAGCPAGDPLPAAAAAQVARSLSKGELDGVALVQLFKLWDGVKNFATWELLIKEWPAEMRIQIAAIMERRYVKLGKPELAAQFHQEIMAFEDAQ